MEEKKAGDTKTEENRDVAEARLLAERRAWRKDHPPNFYARPAKKEDGTLNLFFWECGIPGPGGSSWEGGVYPLTMEFTEEYPSKPPLCRFSPPLFHPNIFKSGKVCLSILNVSQGWRASLSFSQILLGIQDLLTHPNALDPANADANELFTTSVDAYEEKIRDQARRFVS